jgi:HPt (histidine-containing phosphotransfer) domain-containing protein
MEKVVPEGTAAADEALTLTAEPHAESEVFDYDAVLASIDGDSELFQELVGLFVLESADLLDQLRDAIARRDAKAMERAAHSLKGSVGAFHAESARLAAQNLEDSGKRGDFEQAESVFDELEAKVTRLKAALAECRKESALCES